MAVPISTTTKTGLKVDLTGINLLQVAVQELGHSLCLDHSDNETAIMSPVYSGENKAVLWLHEDDVAGIQKLHPLPEGVTSATEFSILVEGAEVPATTEPPCNPMSPTNGTSSWYRTRRRRSPTTTTSTVSNTDVTQSSSVSGFPKRYTTPLYYDADHSSELPDDDALLP
ncbi:hypothetical protein RvY_09915-1 [Ramazzottius varieornatus]|uniref:Peptidase M10 metallopeptidase domain-containing protein n=1 Tax=Ramazzottius varieornatus TaxID=947166 RepID=A0A1D1VIT6_RAMVA|nr:hypothetical protein RvY_09915-1 [Ramazzottius varieornatus]